MFFSNKSNYKYLLRQKSKLYFAGLYWNTVTRWHLTFDDCNVGKAVADTEAVIGTDAADNFFHLYAVHIGRGCGTVVAVGGGVAVADYDGTEAAAVAHGDFGWMNNVFAVACHHDVCCNPTH